jgi:AraC family transcriptional regulator
MTTATLSGLRRGAPSEARPSLGLPPSTLERIGNLVRQAMVFLEKDQEVAMQCLNDVSALLASESHDLRPHVSLARWQTKRTLAYIEANLPSKISTRQLAALVGFSQSHFARAFKRSLGLAPMAYVSSRRIERAKVIMRSTTEPLSQIALACGFADQSHLTRSFQRHAGMSPGLWRRWEILNSGPPGVHAQSSETVVRSNRVRKEERT